MFSCLRAKKNQEVEDEIALMRNGRVLLEASIAFFNGRGNPIRCFSVKELNQATNNYAAKQILQDSFGFRLYKGFLECPIIVKKYILPESWPNSAITDIVFASQMSVHKNVLKLLGCCLETQIPILVFESVEGRALDDHIRNPHGASLQPLSWKHRLKIAVDVANAVAYLHTAFPRPIVHRNLTLSNILLDEDCVAKLSDFSRSVSIPDGKTHVEDVVMGTFGFVAPEYVSTGVFNEKVDVYSFGVILLTLMTGKRIFHSSVPSSFKEYVLEDHVKKCLENKRLSEIVDPMISDEALWLGGELQLLNFTVLSLQCTHNLEDCRPAIIDVAKQLRKIYQSVISTY